jgi:hypothetical protein
MLVFLDETKPQFGSTDGKYDVSYKGQGTDCHMVFAYAVCTLSGLYCPSAFSVLSYLEASVDDTWQS